MTIAVSVDHLQQNLLCKWIYCRDVPKSKRNFCGGTVFQEFGIDSLMAQA